MLIRLFVCNKKEEEKEPLLILCTKETPVSCLFRQQFALLSYAFLLLDADKLSQLRYRLLLACFVAQILFLCCRFT